jgi:hypothetical protein
MRIKIYLSHAISKGNASTPLENQQINCEVARRIGKVLKRELNRYIATDIYIPGGSTEQFVQKAYLKGYLSVDQILEIDCDIISECDFVLCYVPEFDQLQGGRKVEIEHASKNDIPYYVFEDTDHAIEFVRAFFKDEINWRDNLSQEIDYE